MGIINFYKYIKKNPNGTYTIQYKSERYGTYDDITDALHDRDLYMECGWDFGEAIMKDDTPNKYKNMELPAWNKHIPSPNRYITKQKNKYKTYFKVQKTIDGEQKCFGYFESYDEAVKKRDEMERCGWVKETS